MGPTSRAADVEIGRKDDAMAVGRRHAVNEFNENLRRAPGHIGDRLTYAG